MQTDTFIHMDLSVCLATIYSNRASTHLHEPGLNESTLQKILWRPESVLLSGYSEQCLRKIQSDRLHLFTSEETK